MNETLKLIESMLLALVEGGDEMVPTEAVSRIWRVCQTQREMHEQGLFEE